MRFLPDTNIFIMWMTQRSAAIVARMAENRRIVALSAIVQHELLFGAYNSIHIDRNLRQLDGFGLPLLAFDGDDARAAAEIRATLRRQGAPIGPYDALIAGQALARDLTVVTANTGEFSRVAGLRIENWLAG